ncbi:MAG: AmmeMemoRadiSam system protein B [bacterium]|nr:AmmeMemoRadiSam system protein B [bacterium]MDT8396932.1 AmmeMemoRadiSam system protein B [bacterium]
MSRKEASFYRKLVVAGVCLLPLALTPSIASAKSVFEPVVAGGFYPADAAKLRALVRSCIDSAGLPSVKGEILGLVAPHAGYVYSGPVAGYAYRELKGRKYDIVVIMAPSHTAPLNGVSILDVDAYRTPLGEVPVDRKSVRALIDQIPWISHVPALFTREHSMEVQLPFLQVALEPGFSIVPAVMGTADPDLATAFATVLARQFRGRKVLFVASSDMSHYLEYDAAKIKDTGTLKIIGNGEIDTLYRRCSTRESELCGLGPVQTVMHLAEKMGIEGGTLLRYSNSGDTAGNRTRVVGYGSFAFVNPAGELALADKQALLVLARNTLEQYVRTGKRPDIVPGSSALKEPGAAFVTLKRRGELRGCIGQLRPTMPLYQSVVEMAVSSCSRDMRFTPVKAEELPDIRVEVSVMSPFMKVGGVEEVEVGRDGLYLTWHGRSGVLLPQVPGEQGWDRGEYLKAICRKAGLPDKTWEKPGAELYRFSAQVFSE